LNLAVTELGKLDLRELVTYLRNTKVDELNNHLPNTERKKKSLQEHASYIKGGGKYQNCATQPELTVLLKVLLALDAVVKRVTVTGNNVAHSDRLCTKESRDDALTETYKIVEADKLTPETKSSVLEEVERQFKYCTPVRRKKAYDKFQRIH
jgi:hypothetical protein